MTLTDDTWVAAADPLGQLHSAPVPRSPWLRPRPWPSSPEVANALSLWADRGVAALATRAAAQLPAAKDVEAALPRVLTHGDCHLGNLLQGPGGRTLWVDWQEGCLSTGLDDLVFLWQRAESDGAHPPREDMTAAYAAARSRPSDAAFRAALALCELRLLLVAWPPFLHYGSPERQKTMTQRLQQLVDEGARS